MYLLEFVLWMLAALIVAAGAYLLLDDALTAILYELLPEKVSRAFHRLICIGLVSVSLLSGVGFLEQLFYAYRQGPAGVFGWFATFYAALATAMGAVTAYIGAIGLVCLILHVGIVRARLLSEKF